MTIPSLEWWYSTTLKKKINDAPPAISSTTYNNYISYEMKSTYMNDINSSKNMLTSHHNLMRCEHVSVETQVLVITILVL